MTFHAYIQINHDIMTTDEDGKQKLETFEILEEGGAYSTTAVSHQRAVKML